MKILVPLAFGLALAACAQTLPPAIKVVPVETKVPVPVPCIDKRDIPHEPAMVGDELTGAADHDASILAASALRLRATLHETLALLGGCTR